MVYLLGVFRLLFLDYSLYFRNFFSRLRCSPCHVFWSVVVDCVVDRSLRLCAKSILEEAVVPLIHSSLLLFGQLGRYAALQAVHECLVEW